MTVGAGWERGETDGTLVGLPVQSLDLDLFPVFVCELVAAPVLQLLKNTSVYGQAVVDFPEEVLYVCAVGAQ